MNDLIITRLPTLVNTEKMGLNELREQYKRLEGDAIDQAQQLSDACAALHRINRIAHDYSTTFEILCDAYESGDQGAILLKVKQLAELRQKARVKS
jgi:hypothetical protein